MASIDIEDIPGFRSDLMKWYDAQKRGLPWRRPGVTPYGIWISEVMLQQTQVIRVIEYWNKWMKAFPDVHALAEAEIDSVTSLWAGLGYYSRAKNLHKGAKYLIEHHSGELPRDLPSLLKVPSVGPYIGAAVISSAYNKPSAAVDANIIRVYARIHRFEKFDTTLGESRRTIQRIADAAFDDSRCSDWNQAIMDLGAMICRPREVKCEECPLRKHCKAYQWLQSQENIDAKRITELYPLSKNTIVDKETKEISSVKRSDLRSFSHVAAAVIFDPNGRVWMEKRPPSGLLANMWDFPTVSVDELPKQALKRTAMKMLQKSLQVNGFALKRGLMYAGSIIHIFSHIRMQVEVFVGVTDSPNIDAAVEKVDGKEWIPQKGISNIGISSLARKIYDASLKSKSFYGFSKC